MAAIQKMAFQGGILLGTGSPPSQLILANSGAPEGTVVADPGSLYLQTDGGTGNTLWVKETGVGTNTGWALPAGIPAGTPIISNPWVKVIQAGSGVSSFDNWGGTVVSRVPGPALQAYPSNSTITIEILANGGSTLGALQNVQIVRTLRESPLVIDIWPVTFGGTSNPTLGVGEFTSDVINIPLDINHDYWFVFLVTFVSGNDVLFTYCTLINTMEGSRESADLTNLSPGSSLVVTPTSFGSVIKRWVAA